MLLPLLAAVAVTLITLPGAAADPPKVDGNLDPKGRPEKADDAKGVWTAV
jgi:hypothetical protein